MRAGLLALGALTVPAFAAEVETPADRLVWRGPIVAFHDGDSGRALDMETGAVERFRMAGFDAPEISEDKAECQREQRHGIWATARANAFVLGGPIILKWLDENGDGRIDRDHYGRGLAGIYRATRSGALRGSLEDHLIGPGFALPYEGGDKPDWCGFIDRLARQRSGTVGSPSPDTDKEP